MNCYNHRYYGHPSVVNHAEGAAVMQTASVAVVGEEGIRTGREIMTMGGEDFSFFLKERPG
jgi:metal-dependent amidase/aminoacylase/carboxypeptidase family protein